MQYISSCIELQQTHPNVSIDEIYAALHQVQQNKLAGLIVPPFWVKKLRRDWGTDNTAMLGTVIGFPYGFQRTEVKQFEAEIALNDGATNIEVMLNTSAWFSTQNNWVKIEFAKLGKLIHQQEAFFTVTIEASYFDTPHLQRAIKDAIDAGVDYIKIFQPFNFMQSLQIKQWIPAHVGMKVFADHASQDEMQQLIEIGVERLTVTNFLLE